MKRKMMIGKLHSILLTSFVLVEIILSFTIVVSEATTTIEVNCGRCCILESKEKEDRERDTRWCTTSHDDYDGNANRTLSFIEDNSETTSTTVDSWVCFDACFEYRPNNSFVILQRFPNRNESFNVSSMIPGIIENNNENLCQVINEKNENKRNDTDNKDIGKTCQSILTPLSYWGANMVVFANVIYIIPYLIVVLIYSTVSGLRKRAYDRAVLCYNIFQIVLNSILIAIGLSLLCRVSLHFSVYTLSCLALMFLSISSTVWLFVICIDMTLVITRFRWTPPSDPKQYRTQERRKFLIYSAWVWGISFVPTAIASIVELSPLVPNSSPFKPNFHNFSNGPNIAVIVYVATIPIIICLMNSMLFVYTTYKIITIRKSTAIASNTTTKANESYFMFLKLYFLMDAPWITSALGAIYTELWLLKFFRMIQPILMLIVILPKNSIKNSFRRCYLFKSKSITVDEENVEVKKCCFSCFVK
ncbi:PREDICTED: G-protein coupled receptor Mth2-like [Polistes canadensis]|uniref:G-protein coupled receptor Mth2-like n=1 Tax=Polistes canadensis TaxID=91411 RepID=UPI000718DB1B|nr:PREDICTED: G-protein coupled receptor Mth2-like [Polistes canadensis]